MKSLFKHIFVDNWQRKLIAFILSIILWIVVHHSMTTTKILTNIPVKVIHIPPGMTIEGMQKNGILTKKISLTITGNKNVLDELSGTDIQVILDAAEKPKEWVASVSKKNLICFNPEINILQGISKISHEDFIIKMSKLVTQRIPILISRPIGEAPRGYEYLDIWPFSLYVTVSGAETTIKKLRTIPLKLTFNLNDITEDELNELSEGKAKTVSYPIPNSWKVISIPLISDIPLPIDDPQAKFLRIDFIREEMIPLRISPPIRIFFPTKHLTTLNPNTVILNPNQFIEQREGVYFLSCPLFIRGASANFVELVKDMLEIVIIAEPQKTWKWTIQINDKEELENQYIAKKLASRDPTEDYPIQAQEDYYRNRFESYLENFTLTNLQGVNLSLMIEFDPPLLHVMPQETLKENP